MREKSLGDFVDLSKIRIEYSKRELEQENLKESPFEQFQKWLDEAIRAKIREPNAMALATASSSGRPSNRMVLLKDFSEKGAVFFTSYESRKAKEINENPRASAVFFWKELERQVLMEGGVEKISYDDTLAYFSGRPRGSQLGSLASHQDAVIPSRKILEQEYSRLELLYKDKEIPVPAHWGGFRIIPSAFEFWQGRSDRLHDRFRYTLENDNWKIERISP